MKLAFSGPIDREATSLALPANHPRVMPGDREQLRRDEKEIGKNIPKQMIGLDTEDVGDEERKEP